MKYYSDLDILKSMQRSVRDWVDKCFGIDSPAGYQVDERALRFFEEATELVQSAKLSEEQAHAIIAYVYNRPEGDPQQEAGGTLITFLALLNALKIDATIAFNKENVRCWENIERIRDKAMAKQLRGEGLKR